MADIFSKSKRSEIMRAIKSKETRLEKDFRHSLWENGFRYRKNSGKYFGKPDIVLKKYRTVIFIDSCFWHGCKKHFRKPSTNIDFWTAKVERNKKRDAVVSRYYKKQGWNIFRIWEHNIKYTSEKIISRIKKLKSYE